MSQTQEVRGRATVIRQDGPWTVITYHRTDVVRFKRAGDKVTVKLNSNGWRTPTTKLRMNQAAHQFGLGYSVAQRHFDWYVTLRADGRELPFADGMTFTA